MCVILGIFIENDKTDLRQIFLQGFEENACSMLITPAVKNTAAGF